MTVVQQPTTRDVKTPSIVLGIVAAGTLLLALRDPHAGGYGTCVILAVTGYQCPTCGGMRAVHDMAHLDFAGAWVMNPLLTILLPIVGVLLIGWWWRAWRGYRSWTFPTWVVITFAVIVVGFGVARNFF